MSKWHQERYKNDPEYLEQKRLADNAANRHYYRKKKEIKKDDDTRIHSDCDTARN